MTVQTEMQDFYFDGIFSYCGIATLRIEYAAKYVKHSSVCWPVLMCWLCCPCWLCWLAFGCIAPWGWAGCCGADGGVGCWTWGWEWAVPWGGMTPVAVKNWLMEEHRSAIWAASSDQLLSSACRMLSFRPNRRTEEAFIQICHLFLHLKGNSTSSPH